MTGDGFTPLSQEEHDDAENCARVLPLVFSIDGYPPEVAQALKVTFHKHAGCENTYRLEIAAQGRCFADSVDKRDPAAYTLFYIGQRLRSASMNLEGTPFALTQDFEGSIRHKTFELTAIIDNLAVHLNQKFARNKPQP